MRNFGGILLLAGIVGFFYCSSQLSSRDPVPEGLSLARSLEHPSGRLELGRWASLCGAGFGFLMVMFPKGR